MKKILKFLILLVVCVIALGFSKDMIIKSVITSIGSKILGAPIKIGSFSLSFLSQKVQIKNMRIYNPPGFISEALVDFPEIRVDYDLKSLLAGKLYFPLVIVDLKEMVVAKNQSGKLNVDSLKVIEDQKAALKGEKKKDSSSPQKKAPEIAMQIDILKLNVDRVIFKDFSKGEPPKIESFDVGLKNKEFKNIKSPQQLAVVILAQAMSQTAIKSAAIYGVATFLGAGFLPAGVVGVFAGKDDASVEIVDKYDRVYKAALETASMMGGLKTESQAAGIIKCSVQGADVAVKLEDRGRSVIITVSARQFLIPKPELAGGVLYQITEKLRRR